MSQARLGSMCGLTVPAWRAVAEVVGYGPPLIAISRRRQKLLRRYCSFDNLLHPVKALLPWSSSVSVSGYSSGFSQILWTVCSHYMAQKHQALPTSCVRNACAVKPHRLVTHTSIREETTRRTYGFGTIRMSLFHT